MEMSLLGDLLSAVRWLRRKLRSKANHWRRLGAYGGARQSAFVRLRSHRNDEAEEMEAIETEIMLALGYRIRTLPRKNNLPGI